MKTQIRRLVLDQQGLGYKPKFGSGLLGTYKAIEHLGYVQVDTISVIERAHHHVLFSRVPNYKLTYLNELVADKKIFEYWSHAASYLPMSDYRFALPKMSGVARNESKYHQNTDKHLTNEILARFQSEGPLRARDFDSGASSHKTSKGGWWDWGPAKRAIEHLYMRGDLMICQRVGMEKIYDVRERCLPSGIDVTEPTLHEYAKYLFDTTLRAQGVFTFKQLIHLKTGKPIREAMQQLLNEQIEEGVVVPIDAHGDESKTNTKGAFFAQAGLLDKFDEPCGELKILSPFDNALIHRSRLASLFDFKYTIECYVPKTKRKFGYFSLPIVYQHEFVARVDCKAHRTQGCFEVIAMHLEPGFKGGDAFDMAMGKALADFATFNQCDSLTGL